MRTASLEKGPTKCDVTISVHIMRASAAKVINKISRESSESFSSRFVSNNSVELMYSRCPHLECDEIMKLSLPQNAKTVSSLTLLLLSAEFLLKGV